MKKSNNIGAWVLEKNNQFIAFNKPFLCNRIDRPASGIVLFAKNKTSLEHINKQFQFRTIDKTYLCVVEAKPPKENDTLVNWMAAVIGIT